MQFISCSRLCTNIIDELLIDAVVLCAMQESMLQVGEYLDILKAKKSAKEACSAFFCYAVAVRAKYLQLLLLYYRFTSHPYASS